MLHNLDRYDLGLWSLYEQSGTRLPMVASPFYHQLHIVQLGVQHRLTGEDKFAQVAHPALARSRGKNRNRRKRRRDRSLRTPPHLQPTTHCDKNSTPKENSWFATSAPWAWLTD
jgi:D-glucuronyl C5-epimerase C-terminus